MGVYEEIGPTRRLTSTAQLSPKNSASIARMIAELGLRYRPTAQADLEAHAASLALLTRDIAEFDAALLGRAIAVWVRTEKWMPKASELAEAIRKLDGGAKELSAETLAARCNSAPDMPNDLRWVAINGQLKLEAAHAISPPPAKHVMDRRGEPMSEADATELNDHLESLGATARYRADGSRYTTK